MESWKTTHREMLLDLSPFLKIEQHTVVLPDGQVIENWPWIITPDYVNVAVITNEGQYIVFRQTKYSVKGTTLALVGGYIEPGEEPWPPPSGNCWKKPVSLLNIGKIWVNSRWMAVGAMGSPISF